MLFKAQRLRECLFEASIWIIFILPVKFVSRLLPCQRGSPLVFMYCGLLGELPDLVAGQLAEIFLRVYRVDSSCWHQMRHEHGSCLRKIEALLRALVVLLALYRD